MKSRIILMGIKHCGKSTLGRLLAKKTGTRFADSDELIEQIFERIYETKLSFREIYKTKGKDFFQELEQKSIIESNNVNVCALGGGACDNEGLLDSIEGLKIYLMEEKEVLYSRIIKGGIPAFLDAENPRESFFSLYEHRHSIYLDKADITIQLHQQTPAEIVERILLQLKDKGAL